MTDSPEIRAGSDVPISAASRVASIIRSQIIEGELLPGARLPEEQVRADLEVSRSTLREGFQLLVRERLLVHQLSRGFFVRQLSRQDISDLYKVRRIVECAALREVTVLRPTHLHELARALDDGKSAASISDWAKVATASIRFHEALVALADSDRLNTLMQQVLAEFRLSYAFMTDPNRFHSAFLGRNQDIAHLVRTGDLEGAARALERYLADAETVLLEQYSGEETSSKCP
jgi:DNA-binding GntR family transcriptional regulator